MGISLLLTTAVVFGLWTPAFGDTAICLAFVVLYVGPNFGNFQPNWRL